MDDWYDDGAQPFRVSALTSSAADPLYDLGDAWSAPGFAFAQPASQLRPRIVAANAVNAVAGAGGSGGSAPSRSDALADGCPQCGFATVLGFETRDDDDRCCVADLPGALSRLRPCCVPAPSLRG